jgi:hypothetical protein
MALRHTRMERHNKHRRLASTFIPHQCRVCLTDFCFYQWCRRRMSLPTILMPTYASPSTSKAARGSRATRQSRTRAPQVPAHRQPSPTAPFDDDPKWKLFITLNSKICAWDNKGCEPIFTSSSRGIVAAKRAQDGRFSRARTSGQTLTDLQVRF